MAHTHREIVSAPRTSSLLRARSCPHPTSPRSCRGADEELLAAERSGTEVALVAQERGERRRTSSPRSCPWVSLTALKWSTSQRITATAGVCAVACWRARSSGSRDALRLSSRSAGRDSVATRPTVRRGQPPRRQREAASSRGSRRRGSTVARRRRADWPARRPSGRRARRDPTAATAPASEQHGLRETGTASSGSSGLRPTDSRTLARGSAQQRTSSRRISTPGPIPRIPTPSSHASSTATATSRTMPTHTPTHPTPFPPSSPHTTPPSLPPPISPPLPPPPQGRIAS